MVVLRCAARVRSQATRRAGRESESVSLASVSLPKGGAAIKGIDEKRAMNQATSVAAIRVARRVFKPEWLANTTQLRSEPM